MKLPTDIKRLISASLLRLQIKSPFFATLALFTQFQASEVVATAGTDGQDIFINSDFVRSLSSLELDSLILHEVLHAALLHVIRRGQREPQLWNIAADIVVNGTIAQQTGFQLPEGGIRNADLENFSVEEIYDILLDNATLQTIDPIDLLENPPTDCRGDEGGQDREKEGFEFSTQGSLNQAKLAALEAHWRHAIQQAMVVARTSSYGSIPASMRRELGTLTKPQLDWRSYLWRHLVQTPTDFSGFDRRFIGRNLYLEALEGESIQVFVAVDTSGSISSEQMRLFLSEVQGILSAYPHLECELYYADADAYGPYSLTPDRPIPAPVGGGGTSFVPFFKKVEEHRNWHNTGVCVYLTDGYGEFPVEVPSLSVLWVVTPGGLGLECFPFGEAVRLLSV